MADQISTGQDGVDTSVSGINALLEKLTFEVVNSEIDKGLAGEIDAMLRGLAAQLAQAREAIKNLEDMQETEENWRDQVQSENERLRARVGTLALPMAISAALRKKGYLVPLGAMFDAITIAAEGVGTWRPLEGYADYVDNNGDELVQVLCEVAPDEGGDYISTGDHAVGDSFVSIGFRLIDERDDWPWEVAGYDMYHDRFTEARGFRVIGWQPMARATKELGGSE